MRSRLAHILRWLADMPAHLRRWADKLAPPTNNVGGPDGGGGGGPP